MTDFGAERSFQKANLAIQEHYHFTLPDEALKEVTLFHAHQCAPQVYPPAPSRTPDSCDLQTDGCMIPTVFFNGTHSDARHNRHIEWKELRLSRALAKGQIQPTFGAVVGDTTQAGNAWRQTANSQGVRDGTYCHGVGDGAPWIVEQFQKHFGGRGKYLLDLFHVCEKLAAVATLYRFPDTWLPQMKQYLTTDQVSKVMTELYQQSEPECLEDADAPARVALRYLRQRWEHLHYKEALSKNLSVGSGAIESSHRSVIQARLKLAGAWWTPENAQAMAQLRVLRANQQWSVYWNSFQLKSRQL